MGMNLRYSPLSYDQASGTFDFGGHNVVGALGECYGKRYFVCGRSGHDAGDGRTPKKAFKTIEYAMLTQAAHRSSKAYDYDWGDEIIVMPGTYVESMTTNLTNVTLKGAITHNPNLVIVTPTDGSAYAGSLDNATIRGMTFRSSNGTNTTYAAFRAQNMYRSIIDGCIFEAGANIADSTGFRIGLEVGTGTTIYWMQRSRFTNNLIGTRYSGMNFYYGICFGPTCTTSAYDRYQVMQDSTIGWNDVAAETYGIEMNVRYTTGSNAMIRNNNVHGGLLYNGNCRYEGIRAYDRGHNNKQIKVYWNNISAQSDCINGFDSQNVMGNIVGLGSGQGTPADEVMCN